MTIANTKASSVFNANGVTREWNLGFYYNPTFSSVSIYVRHADGTAETVTTNYQINGNVLTYPTVGSALSTGEKLVVERVTPLTQEINLTQQGPLDAETLEGGYDKDMLVSQEIKDKMSRAIVFPTDIEGETNAQEYIKSLQQSVATATTQAAISTAGAEIATAQAGVATTQAGLAKQYADSIDLSTLSTKVSNCITKIPQDIKLELNNGTLILKAGSKVYVPNGTGVFNMVVVSSDVVFHTGTIGSSGEIMVFCNSSGGFGARAGLSGAISSQTNPGSGYYVWYDTANNLIKLSPNGDGNWNGGNASLPIGVYVRTNGVATAIEQVFNGFGYIDKTIFALPGVEGLVPNGRNADGSLNNTKFTLSSVKATTLPATYTADAVLALSNSTYSLLRETLYLYDEKNNFNLQDGAPVMWTAAGKITTSEGRITFFAPKVAYHSLDYNDKSLVAEWAMPSGKITTLSLGANSSNYTAPKTGYFSFLVQLASNGYLQLACNGITKRAQNSGSSNGYFSVCLEVKSGAVVVLQYEGVVADATYNTYRFISAEGAN